MERITELMSGYVADKEIAGAAVRVFKDGNTVYDSCFGYANVEKQIPVTEKTLYRLASMTKPVTAAAIMQLEEEGKLSLEDPLSKYMPAFRKMKVAEHRIDPAEYYSADPESPAGPVAMQKEIESMTYVPAKREVTVYDCLSHSSGLGMGAISNGILMNRQKLGMPLEERIRLYTEVPADFQPGEGTGYSPLVAFDILSYIVEKVSGLDYSTYIRESIMEPLGIRDITFTPDEEQADRLGGVYDAKGGILTDVSDTDPMCMMVNPLVCGYCSGGAGLFGTLEEYGKLAQMYVNGGIYNGVRILKEETVKRMSGEGVPHTFRFIPEAYWGLGLAVFDRPKETGRGLEPGSFGWSGAFGTHFYADPKNRLAVVLMASSCNLGGADSYISKKLERAVYETFVSGK